MYKALSNVDIIYNKGITYIYKPEQFTLKIKEQTYEQKFELVTYSITYNNRHKLTYDLNVRASLGEKPLFTYYNPSSSQYLVKEAYCYFSKQYRNRPILFGFRTNNDEYYFYTYYELKYAKTSSTIAVKNIHKIPKGDEKSRLNQEADIIEKENTLKGKYDGGYGCIYLANKGTNTKEYVVNLGSNVLCSITPSKKQCPYCKNVEVVTYKIVYVGDPQYHLWEHTWYQWSNSYYYIYIYSGTDQKNKGSLIYTYYPRYNDYTAIYVFVFYSVLYVNDPFYIVFSTKEEYNLISSFDVIKSKGSGYSYDFVSVTYDDIPHNVQKAYGQYRKLKFEIGRYKNQHVNTFPPEDSEATRLTYGNKKYKKVIFTPDQVTYEVTGHILFSCRLFSINASEGSCPYGTSKFQESESDKDKIRNKPIKDEVLKDVNYKDFNGVIVFYTNEQIKIDKSFQRTQTRQNSRDRSSDRLTVPENVAVLVEFIVDCNTKTQFVRKDVDGNEWTKKEVNYKSDDELVKRLDEIVENLNKSESQKKFEEELQSIKTQKPDLVEKRGPPPRPPQPPPPVQPVPPRLPTDHGHTTSPPDSGKPTETQRPSEKSKSSEDHGKTSPPRPPESQGRPSLTETHAKNTSHTPPSTSKQDAGRPPAPSAPPHQTKGNTPKSTKEERGSGDPGKGSRGQPGRDDRSKGGHQQTKVPKGKEQGPTPKDKSKESPGLSKATQMTHHSTTQSHTLPKVSGPDQSQQHQRVSPQEHTQHSLTPSMSQEPTGKGAILILIEETSSYKLNYSGEFSYVLYTFDDYNVLNQNKTIKVEKKGDICYDLKYYGYYVVEHDFNNVFQSRSSSRDSIELKIFLKSHTAYLPLRLFSSENSLNPVSLYYESEKNTLQVLFSQDNSKPLFFCYNGGYRPVSDSDYDQNWVKYYTITDCRCLKSDEPIDQLIDELNKVKKILNRYDKKPQVIYHYDDSGNGYLAQNIQDISSTTGSASNATIIGGSVGGVVGTAAVVGTGTGVALKFPELFIPVIKALV